MTRRMSIFDNPYLLGFDQFEQALDRATRNASDGYPPYNIEQVSETNLHITIAVAGFVMDDLSIQLEQNQLIIRGKKQTDDEEHIYLHRGIATRQFQKSFILSDDIEVTGAYMDNGLLNIELTRIILESTIQTIKIRSNNQKKNKKQIDVDSDSN